MRARSSHRAAQVALGVVLCLVVAAGLPMGLFVVLLAAQIPDGLAPEADPCCQPPATWGAVGLGVAFGIAVVAVVATLLTVAVALIRGGARPTRLLRPPAIAVLVATAGYALAILPRAGQARVVPSCDTFRFDPADLRSDDADRAAVTGAALERCGSLEGRDAGPVLARLGAPSTRERVPDGSTRLEYPGVSLYERDGRIVGTLGAGESPGG